MVSTDPAKGSLQDLFINACKGALQIPHEKVQYISFAEYSKIDEVI